MAIHRSRTNIAASGSVANLLQGTKFEYLRVPSAVSVWLTADGTAPNGQIDFSLGNVVVAEDIPPNTVATAGVISRADDGIGSGAGMGGDRIQIRARNLSTANAININLLLEIIEL